MHVCQATATDNEQTKRPLIPCRHGAAVEEVALRDAAIADLQRKIAGAAAGGLF
jgi:hypothetical protein